MSKFINLFGMTTAERLKYLESVVDEIYVLLNEERIWVYKGDFVSEDTEYSVSNLAYYGKESIILESSQIVYFTNGYIGIVNLINNDDSVFTVNNSYFIKGDKGEVGATGKPALTYDNIYYASFPVEVGQRVVQEVTKFNRTANIGDICNIVISTVATPRKTYMSVCLVTNVSSEYVTLTIRAVEEISAEVELDGSAIQFHLVDNQPSSPNNIVITVNGIIISSDKINTPLTFASFAQWLYYNGYNGSLSQKDISMLSCSGYYLDSDGTFVGVITGLYTSSPATISYLGLRLGERTTRLSGSITSNCKITINGSL